MSSTIGLEKVVTGKKTLGGAGGMSLSTIWDVAAYELGKKKNIQ
jgi:hypothetical protein